MIDIHVSGHNAKEILTELRDLLDGTASAPMHVCAHVTPEEPAPVAEPEVKPAEEPPKEPACTTEELRGVLNAVRVKCGPEKVKSILRDHGVESLIDLGKDKYDDVLAVAADLLKEEG